MTRTTATKNRPTRHYDLGGGQGDIVADAQREHADDHQQPAGLWLLLAHIAAPEQLDGLSNDDLRQDWTAAGSTKMPPKSAAVMAMTAGWSA